MSLTFKLGSLAIRTLAKPLSNAIKRNATQHDNFRALCVGFAQRLHRIDMRLRLGLLQDPAAIERQIQRELKEAEKKRQHLMAPTVKTEAETKADEALSAQERKEVEKHVKEAHKPPRIRPLSENKAIETGANFIAETFLFLVAGGLILAESWRRDRKEKKQDADVAEALKVAEEEREEMREKLELLQAEIEALMDEKKPFDEVRQKAKESLSHKPVSMALQTLRREGSPAESTADAASQSTGYSAASSKTAATPIPSSQSAATTTSLPTEAAAKARLDSQKNNPAVPSSAARASTSTACPSPSIPPLPSISPMPSIPPASEPSSPSSSWLPSAWVGGSSKPDDKS